MKSPSDYFEQWVNNLTSGTRTLYEAQKFMEGCARSQSRMMTPDMIAAIQDAIDYFKQLDSEPEAN